MKRILIDLDEETLTFFENKGKKNQRPRKAEIEYYLKQAKKSNNGADS